jgi:hypothetical protein
VRHLFSGPDVLVAHDLAFAVACPGANDRQLNVPPVTSLRHDLTGKKVRDALLILADTLPDTKCMFGKKGEVNPVRHLIGSASAWGGNPETEALYLNVVPSKNDGETVYKLNVKDVPVDGFCPLQQGKNELGVYNLNNITAKKSEDGSVAVQFGGCNGKFPIACRS